MLLHLVAVGVLLAAVGGLRALLQTPYGKTLEAIRQNEEKSAPGGAHLYYKLSLYLLTAALTGLAGSGLALHRSFISPHDLFWLTSATLMVMVLLGGSRGLWGRSLGLCSIPSCRPGSARLPICGGCLWVVCWC